MQAAAVAGGEGGGGAHHAEGPLKTVRPLYRFAFSRTQEPPPVSIQAPLWREVLLHLWVEGFLDADEQQKAWTLMQTINKPSNREWPLLVRKKRRDKKLFI